MKKYAFMLVLSLLGLLLKAQTPPAIIPKPVHLEMGKGHFRLDTNMTVANQLWEVNSADEKGLLGLRSIFNKGWLILPQKTFDRELKQSKKLNPKGFLMSYTDTTLIHQDEYRLEIHPKYIVIKGRDAGIFYGLKTLMQLIHQYDTGSAIITLPCLTITDYPAFRWRGMHLDVSRHFFTLPEVKNYIDNLARYKMNVFHWHLTDDQGWRIEIKKYPLLTAIGSMRQGNQQGAWSEQRFDSIPYGGYYTQEEIRQVVQYASRRQITIVPEIEMPGHSLAALASYPQFSCTGGPFQVARGWGVFDDVYCPKEETFTFLEDVLKEVMELFPSTYIHIGGDECPKKRWKACVHCQALMKEKGIADEHGLQSYFVQRIEKYLNANGRKMIGWDEILEGGLAPHAAVMSWRGEAGGIAAAKEKHEVVMTPGDYCYFDHYQFQPDSLEPIAIGGFTNVEKVYTYHPVPPVLNQEEAHFVMGAQGNVWTEYIPTYAHVEHMALPRMCALSEVLWTNAQERDFSDFKKRFKVHANMLDRLQVNYAKHLLWD